MSTDSNGVSLVSILQSASVIFIVFSVSLSILKDNQQLLSEKVYSRTKYESPRSLQQSDSEPRFSSLPFAIPSIEEFNFLSLFSEMSLNVITSFVSFLISTVCFKSLFSYRKV